MLSAFFSVFLRANRFSSLVHRLSSLVQNGEEVRLVHPSPSTFAAGRGRRGEGAGFGAALNLSAKMADELRLQVYICLLYTSDAADE